MKLDTQSVLIFPKEAYLNRLIGMTPVQVGLLTLIEAKLLAGHRLTMDSISDFLAAHAPEVRSILSQFFRIEADGSLTSDVVEAGRAIADELEAEQTRRTAVNAERARKAGRSRWERKRSSKTATESKTEVKAKRGHGKDAQKNATEKCGQLVDKSDFSVDNFSENHEKPDMLKNSSSNAQEVLENSLSTEKCDFAQNFSGFSGDPEKSLPDSLSNHASSIAQEGTENGISADHASRASNYSRVRACEERSKDKDRKKEDDHHHPYGVTMLRARGFDAVDNYVEEIDEISARLPQADFVKVVDRVIKTKKEKEGRSVEEIHMPYLLTSLRAEVRQKELAKSNDETVRFTPRKPAYNPDEEEKELQRKNALVLLDRYFAEGTNPFSPSILPDPDDPEAKDFDFEPSYVQRVMAERERWEREGRAEEGREAARLEKLQREAEWTAAAAREEEVEKTSQNHGITW